MPERFDLTTAAQPIFVGFLFALGWSALTKLWAVLGNRGQLVVSIIVLVLILVALVLAYRG
jgi:hypothetical protein